MVDYPPYAYKGRRRTSPCSQTGSKRTARCGRLKSPVPGRRRVRLPHLSGCIMISAVIVIDVSGTDQPMLNCFQRLRRSSAYHQRPSIQILFADKVFTGKRVILVCDQIDPAFKEVVDLDTCDLFRLFLQSKDDIGSILKERLHAVLILETRCDLNVRFRL